MDREITITDHIGVTESAFVQGRGEDGREFVSIQRGGADSRTASANLAPGGIISDELHGPASPKSISELRVATALVARLNSDGGSWEQPELGPVREEGIDCVASGPGGERLSLQVTTLEREAWRLLAHRPSLQRTSELSVAVQGIWTAIEHKRLKAHVQTILVLDATDSPRYAFDAVVNEFRRIHALWALGIGFAEIWIVGPVAEMTHRLDGAQAQAELSSATT